MAPVSARGRIFSVAAVIGLAAGILLFGPGAAFAASCPTVDPSTGAVSPPPAPGVDWAGCQLSGASLAGGDLDGANLASANLTNASLSQANLSDSDLSGARLVRATLTGATLAGATMSGTTVLTGVISGQVTGTPASLPPDWQLTGGYLAGPAANLENADLAGANLASADLESALITYADLDGAGLAGADLTNASLGSSNLAAADLSGANLDFAGLSDATLTGATLTGAAMDYGTLLDGVASGQIAGSPASLPSNWTLAGGYLIGPQADLANAGLAGLDLASADLNGANLSGANLAGADLTEADIGGASLSGAILADADLHKLETGPVSGAPASLPEHWQLADHYLVGPTVLFINSSLPGANLSGLDLAGAYAYYANFTGADFDGADLAGAVLNDGTNLTGGTFAGADLSGVTWSDVTCPDGTNSDKHTDGCFSPVDTTPPVVEVTGVRAGHVYALGGVPAAGCKTTDKYSPVIVAATVTVTGKASHGLGVFSATCSGAKDRAGNVAAPVSVTYKVAYGFAGFISPSPGSTLPASSRVIGIVFGLDAAGGRPLPRSTGAAMARAHDVRVTMRGPGISPVRALCAWHSAGRYFRCDLRVPRGVRAGKSRRYKITAYEKDPRTGFVTAPGEPTAVNPETIHFR